MINGKLIQTFTCRFSTVYILTQPLSIESILDLLSEEQEIALQLNLIGSLHFTLLLLRVKELIQIPLLMWLSTQIDVSLFVHSLMVCQGSAIGITFTMRASRHDLHDEGVYRVIHRQQT